MKKILLAVGLGLAIAGASGAEPFSFGVKGGLSMANLTGYNPYYIYENNNDDGYIPNYGNPAWGFNGGFFADLALNDSFLFQPEMNFSMRGVQPSETNVTVTDSHGFRIGTGEFSGTYTFNYLEFPLLFQARVPLASDLKGSLLLGPDLGILLGANEHYVITGNYPQSGSYSLTNGAAFELGANFGAELECNHWLLDLRYDLGLTSVFQNEYFNFYNSVLSLDVGYRIQ